jgi:hypothetical protein
MKSIAKLLHDLAVCIHLRTVADEHGVVTNKAIRLAYGSNTPSSRSRIERLIKLGMIEVAGRNRYRLID